MRVKLKKRCQILKEYINDQMTQYVPCSEKLDQAADDVQTIEYSDAMWDCVALNTQHVELNHLAENE